MPRDCEGGKGNDDGVVRARKVMRRGDEEGKRGKMECFEGERDVEGC